MSMRNDKDFISGKGKIYLVEETGKERYIGETLGMTITIKKAKKMTILQRIRAWVSRLSW